MTILLLILFIIICYAVSVVTALTRNALTTTVMFIMTVGLYILVALYATGLNGVTLPAFDLRTFTKWCSIIILGNTILLFILAPLCKEEADQGFRSTEAGAFIALIIWGILFLGAWSIPHGTPMPF